MRLLAAHILCSGLLAVAVPGAAQTAEAVAPIPAAPLDAFQVRVVRARAHYEALRDGRIAPGDLTRQELLDVAELDRRIRAAPLDTRSFAEKCVDAELQRVRGEPSRLDWEVIRLKCR